MKTHVTILALGLALASSTALQAQTSSQSAPSPEPWERTQLHVGIGVATPQLRKGQSLLASKARRDAEGSYSAQTGWTMEIGFLKPVRAVPGLLLGASFRFTQTGSEPDAGYAEGYFFNPGLVTAAAKYYPLRQTKAKNFFVRGEAGISVLTEKTRFVNERGEQNFFHQFGVGTGALGGLGYSVPVGKRKGIMLEPTVTYELHNTRVEVNGIGDDRWRYGVLCGMLALTF